MRAWGWRWEFKGMRERFGGMAIGSLGFGSSKVKALSITFSCMRRRVGKS
jgi:hypothetical protein